ncbi:hypothetical protein GCM10009785_08220 [Brooklawnia cerclae]|uniref:Outer membrane channel protein CpnT-like N-terminal domain-containing protein n=1 Tax=Brooklawnia cerclae TaxID=349934 RepID=A0ABX0SJ19_9ACTN|nr:hypothetical protein [Brooklawnia cerclae]NIH58399.1 hypothetical protein [Brooklawnia cerclae]
MAIMLPGDLAHFLQLLGFDWPEGNEDDVFGYGNAWTGFANNLAHASSTSSQTAREVVSVNQGIGIDAFHQAMDKNDSPVNTAQDMSLGVSIGGGVLFLMAGAIVALKVAVVIQLVQFAITVAEAIAAAVPTAGASLALIPVARIAAGKAIEFAINLAIEKVLGQ